VNATPEGKRAAADALADEVFGTNRLATQVTSPESELTRSAKQRAIDALRSIEVQH